MNQISLMCRSDSMFFQEMLGKTFIFYYKKAPAKNCCWKLKFLYIFIWCHICWRCYIINWKVWVLSSNSVCVCVCVLAFFAYVSENFWKFLIRTKNREALDKALTLKQRCINFCGINETKVIHGITTQFFAYFFKNTDISKSYGYSMQLLLIFLKLDVIVKLDTKN